MLDTDRALEPALSPPQHAARPAPALVAAPPLDFGTARRAIELTLRLGDADTAWRTAHALLRAFPDAATPLTLLGQALLEAGNATVAADHFRRALRINPLDSSAWGGLAGALALAGKHRAAAAALSRAALHDPLGSEGLAPGVADPSPLGLGIVYLRRGMPDLAAAELARAVASRPRRGDLRAHYAEALRRCGELAEAWRQLADLEQGGRGGLPALLLHAALTDEAHGGSLRAQCARRDPDGALARRFFAPEPTPWELPAAPALPADEDFELLEPYLPLLRQPSPTGRQPFPESAAKRAPGTGNERATDQRPGGASSGFDYRAHAAPEVERPAVEPDPDVKSFIATAERLRTRLAEVGGGPKPLAPWSSGRALTQVILSGRGALERRFGRAAFQAVDKRLRALSEALRRRGIHTHVCYYDDAGSLEVSDARLAPAHQEPGAIRALVQALAATLSERGRDLGVLLIVGGDEIVPFQRLSNPIPDDDPLVLSDNPYASDDPGHAIPQRIVARIPEGDGGDPALLLATLDRMIERHTGRQEHSRLIFPRQRPPRLQVASGYCAEVWRETSRVALDALEADAPLLFCPPQDADTLDRRAVGRRQALYLNLHGAQGLPNFYGQPDAPWSGPASRLPVALRPDHLAHGELEGTMLLTEACYGAELVGRTTASSIPLQALASGASAFIGATVNAYGSSQAPLVAADLLFQRMLSHLAHGLSLGESLHHARHEFAQEMYRRQGYLDDVDVKTLIEFVLLGDPWVALEGRGGEARPSWPAAKIAGIERMPKPRPKAVLSERDVPLELVRRAREALRRMLPGGSGSSLLITAQPNPRRQRKGDPEQTLTFSTSESRATEDGYYLTQAAHVTLSGRTVVKAVQTR
jgi:tetratricopeptide (TPR) repeat protein